MYWDEGVPTLYRLKSGNKTEHLFKRGVTVPTLQETLQMTTI